MKLFEIDKLTRLPIFSEEALTIHPFRDIIKRSAKRNNKYPIKGDPNGRNKELAFRELSFIHFIAIYDSRFNQYEDKELKYDKIKSYVNLPDNWEPDEVILEGCSIYHDAHITESYELYITAKEGINKLRTFLNAVDLNERNKTGTLLIKPKEYIESLQQLDVVAIKLNSLKKIVLEEQEAAIKARGGRRIKKFELTS